MQFVRNVLCETYLKNGCNSTIYVFRYVVLQNIVYIGSLVYLKVRQVFFTWTDVMENPSMPPVFFSFTSMYSLL